MTRSQSLNAFIISLLTIIISSCGGGNSVNKKSFSINAQISEEHPLTTNEINIATRICYAYQSKSVSFRSGGLLDTSFIFSAKKIDCQNIASNYQINSTLKYDDNNELIYSTETTFDPNLKFNKKVQTERSGYLSQLCPKIINHETVSNTIDQQSVKVQISFFHEDLDGFLLQYFNKQPDNSYKIDSEEKFKVPTDIISLAGKIKGMDQLYSTKRACASNLDKKSFSEFEQTFISR